MKEEEAKKKWCPMVRYEGGYATFNRGEKDSLNRPDISNIQVCNCIASACMLWKWFDSNKTQGRCGLSVGGDS